MRGQVWSEICCTEALKTFCTTLVEYKSGGSYQPLPRHPFCISLLILFFAMSLVCILLVSALRWRSALPHHFICLFVACFDVFGSDSVAVSCFSLCQSVNGSLQLFCRLDFSSVPHRHFDLLFHFLSHVCRFPTLLHFIGRQHTVCYRIHPKTSAIPCLDVMTSPFSCLSLG